MENIKDLDAPAFTNESETVINYKGSNYYKACGEIVVNMGEHVTTSCVKRVGHPGHVHEDYIGATKEL